MHMLTGRGSRVLGVTSALKKPLDSSLQNVAGADLQQAILLHVAKDRGLLKAMLHREGPMNVRLHEGLALWRAHHTFCLHYAAFLQAVLH
jgi:hypothetical protein